MVGYFLILEFHGGLRSCDTPLSFIIRRSFDGNCMGFPSVSAYHMRYSLVEMLTRISPFLITCGRGVPEPEQWRSGCDARLLRLNVCLEDADVFISHFISSPAVTISSSYEGQLTSLPLVVSLFCFFRADPKPYVVPTESVIKASKSPWSSCFATDQLRVKRCS